MQGFFLEFEFSPNDFFANKVLTKTYYLENSEDSSVGGVVLDHAEGTEIQWKEGKNISVHIESKKQRSKNSNKTRVVKRSVPAPTFFSFFTPPQIDNVDDEDDEENDDLERDIDEDFDVGEHFKVGVGWDARYSLIGRDHSACC